MAKDDLKKVKDDINKLIDANKEVYTGMEYAADWIELLNDKLEHAVHDAIKQYPKDKDTMMESLTFGLAHFTCMTFEKLERGGINANNDHSLYDVYTEVLLPAAREVVKRELDSKEESDKEEEDFRRAVMSDLLNSDLSIDEIIDKHFNKDMPNRKRKELVKMLTTIKEKAIKTMEDNAN